MKSLSYILMGVFMLSACDNNRIYEQNSKLSENAWLIDEKPSFEVELEDTSSSMNLYVNVRHSAHYPFSNLWLFVNTTLPGGGQERDTLECVLAAKDGRWLGSGLGDIWDVQTPFKSTKFKQVGTYVFELEQAMRYGDQAQIDRLPEIMDVGIRIERAKD